MDYSKENLKQKLGNIAILEGDLSLDKLGFLYEIKDVLNDNIKLEIYNVYKDHSLLLQLPKNNIDTLLMETTFTYEDKIYYITEFLLKLYLNTGWKPKRIVNTMDYGLEAFYIICHKLDIEVYRIDDADDIKSDGLNLKQIILNDFRTIDYTIKYSDFNSLIEEYLYLIRLKGN